MQFHSYLKGKEGKRLLLRSPRNPLETGILLKHAEDGSDVYLTINHVLQAIAEEEIEKGVKRVHAKSGWAIIMDPYNGYILALAQYPFFYPDQYQSYYQGIAKIEDTRVHAIQDVYEPGSSFKPVTLAIALLANQALEGQGKKPIFDPEEKISTSDGRFPGRRSALTDTHFYNYMNMDLALQKSSNIYPAVLVDRIIKSLGKQWYRDQLAHIFQFGQSTGIEFPAESVGLIPRFGKKHANGALEWSVSTPYSLAIGHNLQVNALQLLRVYASFVNGGYLVNPTLLKKVVKDSTAKSPRVLMDNRYRKKEDFKRIIPQNISQRILDSLRYVTKEGGSGIRANVPGFTEGGKTGTANKIFNGTYSKEKYFSNFVGFTPAEKTKFVIFIGIDEPATTFIPGEGRMYYGSKSSAPIFKEIAKRSLKYLGVTIDDPYGVPKGDPKRQLEKSSWFQNVKKLNELSDMWNKF